MAGIIYWSYNYPLFEIGLIDLPKSGGNGSPVPQVPAGLDIQQVGERLACETDA